MADEHELTPAAVKEKVDGGQAQLVDVREPGEWDEHRIAGSVLIPLDSLTTRAGEIETGREVVFVCSSGVRSQMATDAFRASGYDAYNLAGGLKAWYSAGLPIES
jgi:rhodanese-related sulfurtransferase